MYEYHYMRRGREDAIACESIETAFEFAAKHLDFSVAVPKRVTDDAGIEVLSWYWDGISRYKPTKHPDLWRKATRMF